MSDIAEFAISLGFALLMTELNARGYLSRPYARSKREATKPRSGFGPKGESRITSNTPSPSGD